MINLRNNKYKNPEIQEYFNILCDNDFPTFIIPLFPAVESLNDIGMFCATDYNQLDLFNLKYWYSIFNHSVATACIVWHLTKCKNQTRIAFLHDIGTPAFNHCVDFMLKDTINQESSERELIQIINSNYYLKELLEVYKIDINLFRDISKFPVIENKIPKLCADRLEGVMSTCLVWLKIWDLQDIRKFYKHIIVSTNEFNEPEISFNDFDACNFFFEGSLEYAKALQSCEDKLSLNYIGDMLNYMIKNDIIRFKDLYTLTEEDIINRIIYGDDENLKKIWARFTNMDKVYRSDTFVENKYCISINSKKRYVDPFLHNRGRISEISFIAKSQLEDYLKFKDSEYCYIDTIDFDSQLLLKK